MIPIKFNGHNAIIAKDQKEYLPLPTHINDDGIITSCWKLSFVERVKVLFKGCFYLRVYTFKTPLQPLKLSVDKPILL
jgi:hypothetical protein